MAFGLSATDESEQFKEIITEQIQNGRKVQIRVDDLLRRVKKTSELAQEEEDESHCTSHEQRIELAFAEFYSSPAALPNASDEATEDEIIVRSNQQMLVSCEHSQPSVEVATETTAEQELLSKKTRTASQILDSIKKRRMQQADQVKCGASLESLADQIVEQCRLVVDSISSEPNSSVKCLLSRTG